MALLSKKEFAEKCGMETKALAVYIKRGKVVLTGEVFDDTNLQNADFIRKREGKVGKEKKPDGKKSDKPSRAEKNEAKRKSQQQNTLYESEKAKKSVDVEKGKVDLELQRLKLDKLRGALIPTDEVRALFAQHFRSVTVEFNQAADNLLIEISRKTKLNREQLAELRAELIEIVNKAVDRSVDSSKKSIENLVKQ